MIGPCEEFVKVPGGAHRPGCGQRRRCTSPVTAVSFPSKTSGEQEKRVSTCQIVWYTVNVYGEAKNSSELDRSRIGRSSQTLYPWLLPMAFSSARLHASGPTSTLSTGQV